MGYYAVSLANSGCFEGSSAFIFRTKHSKKGLFDPEIDDTTSFRNVRNYLPNDTE
jgi:hypothetical protein